MRVKAPWQCSLYLYTYPIHTLQNRTKNREEKRKKKLLVDESRCASARHAMRWARSRTRRYSRHRARVYVITHASSRGAAGEEHAEAFSRGRVRLMVARRAKKSRKPSRKLRFCEYIHIYIHLKLYMYVQYNLRRSSLRPEAKGEQKWKPLV